jgi:Na+/proline symporter
MSPLDYLVLFGTMIGIAAYGTWQTRGVHSLSGYFKGDQTTRWAAIGISVMATQASAITFMSTPGQGYESGLGFVQNYFGMPLALIIVAAVFLPLYRRLDVYTAYEFLGRRFDAKTRLLGAALFLLQRGLAAGITIYAPAIVLSTVFGWNAGHRLHRDGRQPRSDPHPQIPAGADLRRHGDGVHRAAGEAAGRAHAK